MIIFDSQRKDDSSIRLRFLRFRRLLWDQTAYSFWSWFKKGFWNNFPNFGQKEVSRHFAWTTWKNIQILVRSRFSHFIAIVLSIFVLIRETPELLEIITDYTKFVWYWHLFILLITIGTIVAAVWELRGNKLSATEQERRFVIGVRNLLIELEKFKHEVIALGWAERQESLSNFSENFINIASGAICGKKDVDVGILIYDEIDGKDCLSLYKSTVNAHYPSGFSMPITDLPDEHKGPAFMSFTTGHIAHMPNKVDRFGYVYEEVEGEQYKFRSYIEGWYPVDAEFEDYRSVMSVPISSYVDSDERDVFGVLCFTTSFKDPFIPRDYIMALCLANFLSQAIEAAILDDDELEE